MTPPLSPADLIARVRELKRRVDALESTAPDAVFNEAMSHLNAEYLTLCPQLAERLAETLDLLRQVNAVGFTGPLAEKIAALFPAPAHADTERT